MVQKSVDQAGAMGTLIGDMLHVFKLVGRKDAAHHFMPVDLNTLLDEAVAQCGPAAGRRRIHLMSGPIERLPAVLGDGPYLKQAVINLIDNAIKYSPEGSAVTVAAATHKREAVISVTDHGIGLTEADQSQLFKEFFRSEAAREMTHNGTGLGLTLVKHIMEEMGGSVRVKSRFGKGSTFELVMPIG
jgi:two-component system sensor histidine kinase SenX3